MALFDINAKNAYNMGTTKGEAICVADFEALYREYGLSGITPHAFYRHSGGYHFLVKKLTGGEPFLIAVSQRSRLPFLAVRGNMVCAHGFADESMANAFLMKKVSEGYEPAIQRAEGADTLALLKDVGVRALLFDNTVEVMIEDIANADWQREYGYEEVLQHDRQAYAALCLAEQELMADETRNSFYALFFRLLRDSTVFVPAIAKGTERAPATLSDLETPILSDSAGIPFMSAFLDVRSMERFWDTREEIRKAIPRRFFYKLNYQELRKLFFANPGIWLVFNPGQGSLAMDHKLFRSLEQSADLLWEQKEAAEAEREDDPVPDFLRC